MRERAKPVELKLFINILLMSRSPKTGQRLRYGLAMRERAKTVELPALTALFADIASPKPMRAWGLNPNPGTIQEPLTSSLLVRTA